MVCTTTSEFPSRLHERGSAVMLLKVTVSPASEAVVWLPTAMHCSGNAFIIECVEEKMWAVACIDTLLDHLCGVICVREMHPFS